MSLISEALVSRLCGVACGLLTSVFALVVPDWAAASAVGNTDETVTIAFDYPRALRLVEPLSGEVEDHRASVRLLREAAREGSLAAQTELGLRYQTGEGLAHHRPRAGLRLLLRSAKAGHAPAMLHVADAYREGRGTPADEKEARAWIERLAEVELANDLSEEEWQEAAQAQGEAFSRLGAQSLQAGDAAAAFAYWDRGAQLGDIASTLNSARLLALGQGIPANRDAANDRLEAARHHVSSRMRQTTGIYFSAGMLADAEVYLMERKALIQAEKLVESMRMMIGQELVDRGETAEKIAEGAAWFRLAAHDGSGLAAGRLGTLFLQGHTDLVSAEEALELLHTGADADVWIAYHGLGIYFTAVEPDPEKARNWFSRGAASGFFASAKALDEAAYRRPILFPENLSLTMAAARQGDPEGAFYRGLYHWSGVGLPEDAAAAAHYLAEAAIAKHPGALHYEALNSLAGHTDATEAAATLEAAMGKLEQAAEMGYSPSHAALGRLYQLGVGGAPDFRTAEHHYRDAIALDPSPDAHWHLANLLLQSPEPPADEALQLLTRAAEGGHVAAMVRLGDLHRTGAIADAAPAEAERWYLRAVALEEDGEALFGLGQLAQIDPVRRSDPREALGYFERAALQAHLEGARFVAEAYRDGTAGATHRTMVAARFYRVLVESGLTEYLADLGRMLLMAEAHADLAEVVALAEAMAWPDPDGGLTYFRGFLRFHGFGDSSEKSPGDGLPDILAAADAGFPDAQAFVLKLYLRGEPPTDLLAAVWNVIDPDRNPEAYYYKGRLLFERDALLHDLPSEDGLAMMETAAEKGSIEAMCYLDDLRRKAVDGAPSRERLMTWLQPYADRGFETAIRRLASIHAELEDRQQPARRGPGILNDFGEAVASGQM